MNICEMLKDVNDVEWVCQPKVKMSYPYQSENVRFFMKQREAVQMLF
jgi:hypothetical protein